MKRKTTKRRKCDKNVPEGLQKSLYKTKLHKKRKIPANNRIIISEYAKKPVFCLHTFRQRKTVDS